MTSSPPPSPPPSSSSSSSSQLTFYPAYCHAASPTFHTWVKLSAADVHALHTRRGFEGQHIYFHLNHPVRYVRLVGVLVTLEEYERRWLMVLDDSSGRTIEIVCPKKVVVGNGDKGVGGGGGDVVAEMTTTTTTTIMTNTTGVKPNDRDGNPHPHQHPDRSGRSDPDLPDLSGIDLGSVVKVKGGIGAFRDVRQIVLKRVSVVRDTNAEVCAWAELAAFRATVLSRPWVVPPEARRRLLDEATGRKEYDRRKRLRREREKAARRKTDERGKEGDGQDGDLDARWIRKKRQKEMAKGR